MTQHGAWLCVTVRFIVETYTRTHARTHARAHEIKQIGEIIFSMLFSLLTDQPSYHVINSFTHYCSMHQRLSFHTSAKLL